MTLKAYINNAWVDLSDYIDYSADCQVTTRIDDAFASASIKLWFDRSTPIPPYTPFKIDGEYFVGGSKVSEYLTENNLYIHDLELFEASAILNCFIVGVKVYSKESPTWSSDIKKFLSLCRITERMYYGFWFNVGVSGGQTNETYLNGKITTSKTYTFNATATLFDCLNEICVENGKKLRVLFDDSNPYVMWIRLVDIYTGVTYTPAKADILSKQSSQDAENYGKYLETFASNVVDRTTVTKIDYLEPKADDALLNGDTAKIYLPTPIENIVDFGIISRPYKDGTVQFVHLDYWFTSSTLPAGTYTYGTLATTYQCVVNGQTIYFFDYIYENVLKYKFTLQSKATFYAGVNVTIDWTQFVSGRMVATIPGNYSGKFSKNLGILEKTQWDLLTPQEQARTAFYTIGSNVIENLYGSYKKDIWNALIGQATGNYLEYNQFGVDYLTLDDKTLHIDYYYHIYDLNDESNPLKWAYYCWYNPITNPYIRDSKETTPINESAFREYSRSYGNSANYIDFDKLMPNMHISNETLGKVEKVIEVDRTNANVMIEAGSKCILDNASWYISSSIYNYKVDKITAILTLVDNYNKKAEAIGVDSQQESTANPLKGITERSIYIERTTNDTIESLLSQDLYLRCTFYDTSGNLITNIDEDNNTFSILYIRVSKQAYGDKLLLYCRMLDQILFDFGRSNLINNSYYEQIPYKYTSPNAECGYVMIDLGYMDYVINNDNDPILLPKGTNGTFTSIMYLGYNQIDKDAREKLTFSIMIKHVDS